MVAFWFQYTPRAEDLHALSLMALSPEGQQALDDGMHPDFVLGLYPVQARDEVEVAATLTNVLVREPKRTEAEVKTAMIKIRKEIDRHTLAAHRPTRYVRYFFTGKTDWEKWQHSSAEDSWAVMRAFGPRPSWDYLGFNDGDIYAHLADNANVIAALLTRNPEINESDRHNFDSLRMHIRFRLKFAQLIEAGI